MTFIFLCDRTRLFALILTALLLPACAQLAAPGSTGTSASTSATPIPVWPQPLAETKEGVQQIFGQVAGIAVDPHLGGAPAGFAAA